MKHRPSHRQARLTRKRLALNNRRDYWVDLISDQGTKGVITVGCHTVSYYSVGHSKNLPGVPK